MVGGKDIDAGRAVALVLHVLSILSVWCHLEKFIPDTGWVCLYGVRLECTTLVTTYDMHIMSAVRLPTV